MATPLQVRSAANAGVPPRRTHRALARFMRNRAAVFGALLVALVVAAALFAPWLTPYDPVQASFMTVRQAPSATHWFGTDELGRDVLSRLLFGARASLLAGVVSVGIAVVLGVPL
ncbi:ABC transporter permease, partial [Mesorhizobium sp. M8A.F.Ca.ET.207.01.1.1]